MARHRRCVCREAPSRRFLALLSLTADPLTLVGTAGLGKQTILSLAPLDHPPARIYFTGRESSRGRATELVDEYRSLLAPANKDNSRAIFLPCDLTSFESIKHAMQSFVDQERAATGDDKVSLHVVLNNAGIMAVPPGLTKDGYEIQFGTNHMGHALLVELVLPYLLNTMGSRVVNVSSLGAGLAFRKSTLFDPTQIKTTQEGWLGAGWWRYGQSKLANILFSQQLALRHPSVTSVSIHPGVIKTDLVNGLPYGHRLFIGLTSSAMMISLENGAKNHLWASTVPVQELKNGGFYEPVGEVGREFAMTKDDELAVKLWELTQKELEGWKLDRP